MLMISILQINLETQVKQLRGKINNCPGYMTVSLSIQQGFKSMQSDSKSNPAEKQQWERRVI